MTQKKKKVLVYGASGIQGGAIAEKLVEMGHDVRTVIRNLNHKSRLEQKGIYVYQGDLNNRESLLEANKGVEQIVLLIPVNYDVKQNEIIINNVLETAKKSGVHHVIFNTSGYVPDSYTGVAAYDIKIDMVNKLKESGIDYTVLMPTLYLENLMIPGVVSDDVLAYPVPSDEKISWVSIEDAALYTAIVVDRQLFVNENVPIVGPDDLTGEELAQKISDRTNRNIQFYQLPVHQFKEGLIPVLGENVADGLALSYEWINKYANLLPVSKEVPNELRYQYSGTSVEKWIEKNFTN